MKVENIKFKSKSILDGAWVQGDLVHKEDGKIVILRNGFNVSEVDPSTVCQYTGLADCEGNEIWEHDLLQSQKTKAIYEVVWDENGCFIIKDSAGGGYLLNFLGSILSVFKFKVVGNKFDRKEGEE